MPETSTADLTSRARRGDRDAFGELIRRYERTALAVAYAAVGDENTAGDAAQEGFLRAWRRLDMLKDDAKFASWLCCIVRNAALDLRRRSRGDGSCGVMLAEHGIEPADELERQEEADRVSAALASLDEASRTAVVLRYYEGLSAEAIAEVLMTKPSAVYMRLSRARETLKRRLVTRERIVP